MDHISRINTFLEVVKHRSFSGAARALGNNGPAVSKQIKALEERLGVKLLTRTTRHVSLTEEGAIYYETARKALADLSEAEAQILEHKDCPTGRLKINAPLSFGNQYLTQPIARFAQQYPEVEMEVDFSDRWVDVVGEGFDLVVRIGVLEDSGLIARKLAPCPLILCTSKETVKHHGLVGSVSELASYPWVAYNQHSQSERWRYQTQQGEVKSQAVNQVFAANTAEMQLTACLEGVGAALIPIFSAAKLLQSGDLLQMLPEYKTYPERGIYALYPQNSYLSTRTRLFLDWLRTSCQSLPWD